jgi:hypothetical protein
MFHVVLSAYPNLNKNIRIRILSTFSYFLSNKQRLFALLTTNHNVIKCNPTLQKRAHIDNVEFH